MKTPKPQKIKLMAKNPRKIRTALKSWSVAWNKVDSDPMKLDEAPPWVEKALNEVVKTFMPSKWLPTEGELDISGHWWRKEFLKWRGMWLKVMVYFQRQFPCLAAEFHSHVPVVFGYVWPKDVFY